MFKSEFNSPLLHWLSLGMVGRWLRDAVMYKTLPYRIAGDSVLVYRSLSLKQEVVGSIPTPATFLEYGLVVSGRSPDKRKVKVRFLVLQLWPGQVLVS